MTLGYWRAVLEGGAGQRDRLRGGLGGAMVPGRLVYAGADALQGAGDEGHAVIPLMRPTRPPGEWRPISGRRAVRRADTPARRGGREHLRWPGFPGSAAAATAHDR